MPSTKPARLSWRIWKLWVALPKRCCKPRLLVPPLQTIIGKQLKQYLDIPEGIKIGYSVFVSGGA